MIFARRIIMFISTKNIVTITEANQQFNKVTKTASKYGDAIIFKHNKPTYVVFDIAKMGKEFVEEYEKLRIKFISSKVMDEYAEAYEALAK